MPVLSRHNIGPDVAGPISSCVTPGEVSTACTALLPPSSVRIGCHSSPLSGGLTADILNQCPAPSATYSAFSLVAWLFQLTNAAAGSNSAALMPPVVTLRNWSPIGKPISV